MPRSLTSISFLTQPYNKEIVVGVNNVGNHGESASALASKLSSPVPHMGSASEELERKETLGHVEAREMLLNFSSRSPITIYENIPPLSLVESLELDRSLVWSTYL